MGPRALPRLWRERSLAASRRPEGAKLRTRGRALAAGLGPRAAKRGAVTEYGGGLAGFGLTRSVATHRMVSENREVSETAAQEPREPEAATVAEAATAPEVAAGHEPDRSALPPIVSEPVETVVAHESVSVRRSPRYMRFLVVGASIGIVVALILTVAFPANADFDRGQVFGFLLLFFGVIGLGLGAVVALILDRRAARRSVTLVADRIDAHTSDHSQ